MTSELTVRHALTGDAAAILDIYGPIVAATPISFEEVPPTLAEIARRIDTSHEWLVAEEDARVCGYAYAGRFHPRPAYRWSVEVSIYLSESARGRGVGKLLLRALLDSLRKRGFVNAFAGTTLPNDASVSLFESFGFEKIAHQKEVGFKLGAWHDVGWWQLQLQEPPLVPLDPGSTNPA